VEELRSMEMEPGLQRALALQAALRQSPAAQVRPTLPGGSPSGNWRSSVWWLKARAAARSLRS
jgi:hypothetical protein